MTAPWGHYARYNCLANETLYEACARLSEEQRRRNLGAFFCSIHGIARTNAPRNATSLGTALNAES